MAYDNKYATKTTNRGDGGGDYPHPPGDNNPKGDNGGKGFTSGGSGPGEPSYRTGRGGFGNIHSNGMLLIICLKNLDVLKFNTRVHQVKHECYIEACSLGMCMCLFM